jgi:hypothetical protein
LRLSEVLRIQTQTRNTARHKRLINSFLLANLADAILTGIGLNLLGFREIGVVAGGMLAADAAVELLIFKIAITAFMIGIYALAVTRQGRWSSSIQSAVRIGNIAVWLVVAWNELNILSTLF